jgi:peptidyl-prolyl cis-trans isomerase SurA
MIKQLLISIIFIFSISAYGQSYKIIKLVNDQVITNYDLEKRLQLFSILNNVEITDNNIDHYAKEMIKLMVDEKIQIEQIKKYNIKIKESEVKEFTEKILMSSDDAKNIENELKINDINISILEDSIKIQLGWNELSNRLFYRDAEISEIDLKNALSQNPSLSIEQAKYLITQNQVELRSRKLLRDLRAESNIENR